MFTFYFNGMESLKPINNNIHSIQMFLEGDTGKGLGETVVVSEYYQKPDLTS